jgi:putative transposase
MFMSYNPKAHHRQSIRLRSYDYSQPGWYFITICTYERRMIFGDIVDGQMILNGTGKIVEKYWREIINPYHQVNLHDFVIMPNHLHGIIQFVGAQFIAPNLDLASDLNQGAINRAPTIGEIVRSFKARCTWAINKNMDMRGVPVWQRNYHEHIIRSQEAYSAITEYVRTNPQRWQEDTYHA